MVKIKGWKKVAEGNWENINNFSFVTIDPDMDSTGKVFWVVHIRTRDIKIYIIKKDTKKEAMNFAMNHMRSHPNG